MLELNSRAPEGRKVFETERRKMDDTIFKEDFADIASKRDGKLQTPYNFEGCEVAVRKSLPILQANA